MSFWRYGKTQRRVRTSLSYTGTYFTNFPKFSLGYGNGVPRSGTVTFLFYTSENFSVIHYSNWSMSCLLWTVKFIIFEEYHFLWKSKRDSLIPGWLKLLRFPQLNLFNKLSGLDNFWFKLKKCQPSD